MNTYGTSEIPSIMGIHPNTVRLYEKWGLISRPERRENGYRIFTDLHIQQIQLARTAFQIEVLQGGLRKKMVQMPKASAAKDFEKAMTLTHEYLEQLKREQANAEKAIEIVSHMTSGSPESREVSMKRRAAEAFFSYLPSSPTRSWYSLTN